MPLADVRRGFCRLGCPPGGGLHSVLAKEAAGSFSVFALQRCVARQLSFFYEAVLAFIFIVVISLPLLSVSCFLFKFLSGVH